MYQISIRREALKELAVLPKRSVLNISVVIDQLAHDPRPTGCKKLKGSSENLWRIRVGDYRIIYNINDAIQIVEVRKIGHRKEIYD